jgi:NHLM bacteriocin system ABC transporter ATP-binding protein
LSILGEQIQKRRDLEEKNVKTGEQILGRAVGNRMIRGNQADLFTHEDELQIAQVAQYLKLELPDEVRPCRDLSELIEVMFRPSGAEKRRVRLSDKWWKNADGPLIAVLKENGHAVALFPGFLSGLYYIDQASGKKVTVTEKNANIFEETAFYIYLPIPGNVRTGKDFLFFLIKQIRVGDLIMYAFMNIFLAVVWSVPTVTTQLAFSRIIPTKKVSMLVSLMILLFSVSVGEYFMRAVRITYNQRIVNRLDLITENSVYSRVLHLPTGFFADQTAGGLSQKIAALNKIPTSIGDMLFIANNIIISLLSCSPLLLIAPELILPVVAAVLLVTVLILITSHQEKRLTRSQLDSSEKNSSLVFDMISGIQRIHISDSERRAYGKWLRTYSKLAGTSYALVFPLYVRPQMINMIRLAGILWAFQITCSQNLSVAQFASFTTAYAVIFSCLKPIISKCQSLSQLGPILKAGEIILQAEPESNIGKKDVPKLNGNIELSHVTFRYEKNDEPVWEDLSLKINPGEYVALVGKSGCGKSTLVKLLLGFAVPESGGIYYDGNDLQSLDPHSLRKCIGTVLQDDKLFAGDLFSNITISAPWLGMDDAWEAAEKAGIAEDIRRMPMGMDTMLSEGGGGISGGQKQRILIARAIAPKPSILIFDEATSALDNITQKAVTQSLNELKCTRIVIAHRLSTIRECDRIIALDNGKMVESGTYDELVKKNGFFADLVARQQIGK